MVNSGWRQRLPPSLDKEFDDGMPRSPFLRATCDGFLHLCLRRRSHLRCKCKLGICSRLFSQNELTGEHSCIMLKLLKESEDVFDESWLSAYMTGK